MARVKCELCPTECVLGEYEIGGCRTRINRGGELFSLVYGKPCSVAIDPIEKKPFFHFLPGTTAFSIATAGCVLGCKFCQNWQISQARPEETEFMDLQPDEVVRQAMFYGSKSICYTYTEPTVFYEYMLDTAVIAKTVGVRNTAHTCGYINRKPLKELCKHLDAADVDLKAFTEDFYGRVCGGRLRPVLDAITTLREEGVWVELTNLIIPTLNDNMEDIRRMCAWIVKSVGPDTPIHFSRFFPYYKLKDLPPTPMSTLTDARKVALDAGLRFVYIGNIRSEAENTYCPKCRKAVIERTGYVVSGYRLTGGKCSFCGFHVSGVWA